MTNNSPKRRGFNATHLLKEAILDVLLEGMLANERIGPQKITERTGLPPGDAGGQHRHWVAFAFLQVLIGEKRVWKPSRGHYELTSEEFSRRCSEGASHLGKHV